MSLHMLWKILCGLVDNEVWRKLRERGFVSGSAIDFLATYGTLGV